MKSYEYILKNLDCANCANKIQNKLSENKELADVVVKIFVSGRSIGDINVQIILEKLGGGGHITVAGAQLEGMTLEEAKQELIIRINEYFTEIA